MTKTIACAPLLLALCACWLPAQADTIYRCGDSYASTPCPGAVLVAADDQRSEAQRAQTEAAARRDARLADAMEQERLRQEAKAAKPAVVAVVRAAQAKPAAEKAKPQSKLKKPELFTAVSPRKPGEPAPKKKKKTATA